MRPPHPVWRRLHVRPWSTTSPPIGIIPASGELEGADVAQQHSQRYAPVHEKHSEQKGWQVKGTRRKLRQVWELLRCHAGDLQWRNAMKDQNGFSKYIRLDAWKQKCRPPEGCRVLRSSPTMALLFVNSIRPHPSKSQLATSSKQHLSALIDHAGSNPSCLICPGRTWPRSPKPVHVQATVGPYTSA